MGKVTVRIDLDKYKKNAKKAQFIFINQVFSDCKLYMPLDTGILQQRSYISSDNRSITFPGPSSRYLYGGKKMVNSVTGKGPMLIPGVGFRYKKGTKLKVTDENLKFKRPEATAAWFETAKRNHIRQWRKVVINALLKR